MPYTPPAGNALELDLSIYDVPSGDSLVLDLGAETPAFFPPPELIGMEIRGRIGPMSTAILRPGIYQMRMTRRGKVPIRMKFYSPTNPQTVAQQANRAKYTDAVSAWQNLTDEEKTFYNKEGLKRRKRGYDYFRSLHLKGEI